MTRARDLAAFVSNADGDIKFDTDTLFIDSSANRVGIGETSPSSLLHLKGSTSKITLEDSDVSGATCMIQGGGAGNLTISADPDNAVTSSYITFQVDASEAMRIDSSDRVLIGTNSSRTVQGFANRTQIEGTSATTSSLSIVRNSNSVDPPYINFGKTRSTSTGGSAIIQQNDVLGRIDFAGGNGSNLNDLGARIDARVDGTPGSSGDMPARITFSTSADGSSAPTQRLSIPKTGGIVFSGGDSAESDALDDYEEGTWTPAFVNTFQEGAFASATGFSSVTGVYVKIGNFVRVWAKILGITGSSGNLTGDDNFSFTTASLPYEPDDMSATFRAATGQLTVYQSVGTGTNASGPLIFLMSNAAVVCQVTGVSNTVSSGSADFLISAAYYSS